MPPLRVQLWVNAQVRGGVRGEPEMCPRIANAIVATVIVATVHIKPKACLDGSMLTHPG